MPIFENSAVKAAHTPNYTDAMAYSKEDLIQAGIPLDLTIESIYQEYKRGGLTQLPRVTMSGTLRRNYPSINTLEDLFESTLCSKSILTFEAGILAYGPTLCTLYDKQNKSYLLPSTLPSPLTLENGLRAFLPEYIAAKKERAAFLNLQVKATYDYCKAIDLYFDETASNNSRDSIATSLKTSRQNVDNKIKQAQQEFSELFLDGNTVDQITIRPELVAIVKNVKDAFPVPGDKVLLDSITEIKSPRLTILLATIFGYKILDSGLVVGNDDSGQEIDRSIGRVKSLLKRHGIPCPLDEFTILLDKSFKNDKLKQDLETYSKSFHEFEILHDGQGKELIAVKWNYLSDLTTEIIRILYDNGAWEPKLAMSGNKLQQEWERRARLAKRNIEYNPHYKHWRLCATKTGHVYLKKNKGVSSFLSGQSYVNQIILNNPTWSFDQFYAQADKDGYTNIYPIKSLRAYYTAATDDLRIEKALDDAIRFLGNSTNQTMAFSNLVKAIAKTGNTISANSFELWLRKNNQAFNVFSVSPSRRKYVKLLNRKAKLITTVSRTSAAKSPNVVQAAPSVSAPVIDWTSIEQFINLQVSEIQAYPELQGVMNKLFLILKDGKTDIAPNSCFLRWLPDLTVSNTMTSSKKDIFRITLLCTVEAYIQSFYQLKYKQDIINEINNDPSLNNQTSAGLGTMFFFLAKKGILPAKFVTYQKNSLPLIMLKAVDSVKKARNDIAHPNGTINLADNVMSAQIHDTLLVFLYLASKL